MKTAVTKTSVDSFHEFKAGNFNGQHAAILAQIQPGQSYSRRPLAMLTGFETSAVAARVNELIAQGQVEVQGTLKCVYTGRVVEAVKRVPVQMGLV